ncbi:MAG: hypothetical protein H7141_03520 [Burkholderiales bacterium]|nr:hypothetical protein [Bacteroidia bacterium]
MTFIVLNLIGKKLKLYYFSTSLWQLIFTKNILLILGFVILSLLTYGQENKYKEIIDQLLIIDNNDIKYRIQVQELGEKFGLFSKEVDTVWLLMNKTDSINQVKVKSILDKYGWLGIDDVGIQCNAALFRVIQHSDIKTQEQYLPIMQDAVKNRKANPSQLTLLEDRILLRQGKKQIYGSQIGFDSKTKLYYVSPLEDPDNVDKRRGEIGLEPLSIVLENYFETWHLKWDVGQYKKDLPTILEMFKPAK